MANTTFGAQGLLQVISLKRNEIVALLLKHGIVVNSTDSDMSIAVQVTNLAKTSKSFYNAFMKLLLDKDVVKSLYSSMDGYSNAGGVFYDPMKIDWGSSTTTPSTTTPPTTPSKDTKTKGSGQWLTTGLNLLQTGFNGYLQLDDNKTKRELAAASVKVVEAGGNPMSNTPAPAASSNTALYVILGIVGVSVIGLVVYLATKKKS